MPVQAQAQVQPQSGSASLAQAQAQSVLPRAAARVQRRWVVQRQAGWLLAAAPAGPRLPVGAQRPVSRLPAQLWLLGLPLWWEPGWLTLCWWGWWSRRS